MYNITWISNLMSWNSFGKFSARLSQNIAPNPFSLSLFFFLWDSNYLHVNMFYEVSYAFYEQISQLLVTLEKNVINK